MKCVGLAAFLGVVSQHIIDGLSHEYSGGFHRRTRLLHDVTGGLLLAGVLAFLGLPFTGPTVEALKVFAALASAIGVHLLLDSLNPSGVYLAGRRLVLARIRYDDPLANYSIQLFSLSIIIAVLAT